MAVDEQKPSGIPDGWALVQSGKADTPAPSKGHDFKVLGINIHVPAEEKPRLDSNMVGVGENGAGIAPEDALMAGQAGKRILSAAPGVASRVMATMGEVAPMVKYEAVKTALRATGLPEPAAAIIAGAVVGISGKGKAVAAEAGPVDAEAAHLDRSVPVQPSKLTPQQFSERIRFGSGTPPAAVEKPMLGQRAPGNTIAPAVTDAQQAAIDSTSAPVAKSTMAASETKEYLKQRAAGKTDAQARSIIEASRALNKALGLSTPSAADLQFPKGMRGGAP